MEYILKANNLRKKYNNFILKDINFNIPKGCIMGLIGENGAGKTTTIKLILNLIKKDGGSVEVFGLNNIENELEIKERIGVVLDESYFHGDLNPLGISLIMKNIYKNWDNNLFLEYLRRFKLPEDKTVKEFSKGMKMKLSISVAFSHHPQLLILDEPTSGLDPMVRNEVLEMFLEFIQDENKSILFSTHITSDLDKIADYITFIHKGEVEFSKRRDKLIDSYGIIKCGKKDFNEIEDTDIISYRQSQFGYEVLINDKKRAQVKYKDLVLDSVNLEDIMLFYIGRGKDERINN